MTQPPNEQPGYGQPGYGQPQYGQPQYGQPQYGQWAPPAGPSVPPQYGPSAPLGQPAGDGQWELLGGPGADRPGRPRRGRLIASAAVVVALAGGGAATYVAVSDSHDAGAATPRGAVEKIFDDLNRSDLLGVLDDLAPAERTALAEPARAGITELKRLKVLQGGADPGSVTGITFRTEGLTYADRTEVVNDHVQVVQLTGGRITVGSDLAKVPFTREFLAAAFPDGPPKRTAPTTTDLAARDHGPVRLAAQKVDGRWYPSIFYTIADNAAHDAGFTPTPSDEIPARGAPTPEGAVTAMVKALLAGDRESVIALLSPDELAAVHDYGTFVLHNLDSYRATGVTVEQLELTSTAIPGGGRRVTLATARLHSASRGDLTLAREGDCFRFTVGRDTRRFCAADLADQIVAFGEGVTTTSVTPAQRAALTHLIAGLTDVGVEVSETGGSWYVTPVRSMVDVATSALKSLQGDDLLEIVGLLHALGN